MREIGVIICVIAMMFCMFKIGYYTSEVKFSKVMLDLIERIDPHDMNIAPGALWAVDYISRKLHVSGEKT